MARATGFRLSPVAFAVYVLVAVAACSSASDGDGDLRVLCEEQQQAFAACGTIAPGVTAEDFVEDCVDSVAQAEQHAPEGCADATVDWIECTRDAQTMTCDAAATEACGAALEGCG